MHAVKKIRQWGNIYAIPISKKEAKALGLRPGDEVDVELARHGSGLDLRDLPTAALASSAQDLDEVAEREAIEDR